MRTLLETYFTPLITAIIIMVSPLQSFAAETVTSSGQAYITSSINKDIYRSRAIENALQKIVLGSSQKLNSFSVVENGRVLLDQIQTQSAVKILQYEVVEESIKNKMYRVTLQAILDNDANDQKIATCRKANIDSIDFSLATTSNSNQFPAWANISKDWINRELTKYSFAPNLKISQNNNSSTSGNDLYTLFKQKEPSRENTNIYKMKVKIIFERENKNNPIEKTIILKAKIKTSLGRKNKTISEKEFTQPYRIHQRVFNKLFQTADRGDWEKVKNHFSILLKDQIQKQMSELTCLKIEPKIFAKAGKPFIDYGQLDGIEETDMLVINSPDTKKTYLKVVQIKDHEAQVEIVSKQQSISDINGKSVELVAGS